MKAISSDSISDLSTHADRDMERKVQEGRIAVITWMKLNRKSSGQISRFLQNKGYNDALIGMIRASLSEDGYIDDAALARKIIRQRQGMKAESRRALKHRLFMRGIADEAISSALPEEDIDLPVAINLLSLKYRKVPDPCLRQSSLAESRDFTSEQRQLYKKAGRFLISRGFETHIVLKALREYFPGIDIVDAFQA